MVVLWLWALDDVCHPFSGAQCLSWEKALETKWRKRKKDVYASILKLNFGMSSVNCITRNDLDFLKWKFGIWPFINMLFELGMQAFKSLSVICVGMYERYMVVNALVLY